MMSPESVPLSIQVFGIAGLPEFAADDDIAGLFLERVATGCLGPEGFADGDVVVVTSKIVSKVEGRVASAVDREDAIIEVHGYAKQGSGYGYSGVRGINALLATVKTTTCAPVIIGQRLRRGACGSPRGAARSTPSSAFVSP